MSISKMTALTLGTMLLAFGQLTPERIAKASAEPQNWLTYSSNYAGHRFSPLKQINESNVGKLKVEWSYQVNSLQRFEGTPIVVDGVMYASEPPSNLTAIDVRTGRPIWKYRRSMPTDLRVCCGQVNRGVAVSGNLVFLGTLDAHLLALNAKTGAILWDVTVANYKDGYSLTGAPLIVKDKVITGMAGGEYGVRGFLDAYDVATGKRAWRFWTIPMPGEPGGQTWAGDSGKTGAAATWVTGTYDPETNLVYWGTGNPGPDWNGDVRAGDNLYSDCILAIDADSGKLKWHFQFTPHDVHDWDSTAVPVLVNANVAGQPRKLVVFPNRNAFFYVLDRVTGQFITGKPYAKQTWAKGLDDSGRPVRVPASSPSVEGTQVWPSVSGASNWYSPSFSPETGLLYVAVRESGSQYFKGEAEYKAGEQFNGGGFRSIPGEVLWGAIRAFDPATGNVKWEYKLFTPPWSGVMSTAGNLVFGSTAEGQIFALSASTGKELWRFEAGGQARGNPISYAVDGKQFVAVTMGNALYVLSVTP
ncbi:MAG: PQQ-dependent dehydrogenase, methanol/ethanol family [Acidobacteria bacterium]|nr:PQQ-dependent dehydrogenase, methanol/ethanol family [Acidobacteriota bacterium]